MPVAESFGFSTALRTSTSGQAFPSCVFHHWDQVNGNPLEKGSKVADLVKQIRKRKGLTEEIPTLQDIMDKL